MSVPDQLGGHRFTFSGSGWGHGVGMSRWGAAAWPSRGSSAAQILGHYYSGTTVTTTSTDTIRVLLATSSTLTLTPWGHDLRRRRGAGRRQLPVTVTSSGSTIQLSGGLNSSVTGTVSIALGGPPLEVAAAGQGTTGGSFGCTHRIRDRPGRRPLPMGLPPQAGRDAVLVARRRRLPGPGDAGRTFA